MSPKTLILFLSLGINSILAAQSPDACSILKDACDAGGRQQYDSSILLLQQLRQYYPEHPLVNEISYRVGRLHSRMERYHEAKLELLKFIYTPDPGTGDRAAFDDGYMRPKTESCCSWISRESYADLQHYSCLDLHEIYLKENNADSALYYLTLADKKFTMRSDCVNGIGMQAIQFAISYSAVYLARGDTAAAIQALVKRYFINEAGQAELTHVLTGLLRSKYTKEEICAAYDAAIDKMTFELKKGKHPPIATFKLILFGTEVSVSDYWFFLDGKKFSVLNKEDAAYWIRNDYRYKQLLK